MKGVVRSILQTNFKDAIEDIVQLRSRVQALGNLVFNKAILLACASGSLPEQITSQAFIGACQRAVCVRDGEQRPSIVNFKHVECLPFLEQAQHYVIQKLNTFDNSSQLTETFNQAAREYVTVLKCLDEFYQMAKKANKCTIGTFSFNKAINEICRRSYSPNH
jgi:hypothetical protein